jgi:glycerol transport system ATP-binding protein
MGLKLENVNKTVDGETHLRQIDLEFETGSRNVLLGRTLSGKTSCCASWPDWTGPPAGKSSGDGQDVTGVSVRENEASPWSTSSSSTTPP